jgi:cysteinyl-tRNA synthetase
MKLHNTLTRSTDPFKPLNGTTATLYTCGPTVYAKPTIGNWASYVRWDILARALKLEFELEWYLNLTDVGHLVSDGDEGEDKLEQGARREGKTAWEVADFYIKDFKHGLDLLNISIDRDHLIKATDHIDEQIDLVKRLEEKGFTYVIDDGVYFDSTKFPEYGKMAQLDLEGQQAGARVEMGQKRNASDFALWKLTPAGQKRDMEWDSPWGKGFPGWHIECSAMAMKYLGETLDIHTGGIDHIPVHHTNEIAQSEAATGKPFSQFWLHSNFLQVNGSKISKSVPSSVITLDDLQTQGYTAMDYRMFILQSHYQTEANFTWEGQMGAQNRLRDLQAVADMRFQLTAESGLDQTTLLDACKQGISDALAENLNTPKALAMLSAFVSAIERDGIHEDNRDQFEATLNHVDDTLGFRLLKSQDISSSSKELILQRTKARENKDWDQSDQLRDELLKDGIKLNDTPRGTFWSRL